MKTKNSKLFFVLGATMLYLGLFSPINAQAQQTQFNTMSNDRPTIQVTNYTKNPTCSSCWSNSVSADPGDIISVYIYYHNTGSVTANSVKAKLNASQGVESQYHSISGSISASNANTVNGSASINLSQPEALVFDNYVKWYPNHNVSSSANLLSGQSGIEVLNSNGLNLGNIGPDVPLGSFSTQGSVVVRFRVTNTVTPPAPTQTNCSIQSFTANPNPVSYGYFASLGWNTTNCNNLTITGNTSSFTNLNTSGAVTTGALYNPTNIYTLSGYGDNGLVQKTVTVTVTGQPSNNCVINYFQASPNSNISYGGTTLLNWTTQNCNNVSVTGGNTNQSGLPANSSLTSNALYGNTTFVLTAYGNNGSDIKQLSVTVNGNNNNNNNCEIDYFYASPDHIDEGDDTTLYWATTDCSNVSISNGIGNVSNDGQKDVNNLYNDKTYTLTASGNYGSDSKTITVYVDGNNSNNDDCEIDDFYASPNRIDEGEKTTLYWNTTDCNNVSISNGIGNVSNDGNEETPRLYSDRTYTITAYGNNGSDSETITVRVDEDNNNNNDRCEIDDFYASPSSITQGQSFRLYWETTDCDDVYISNGIGNRSRNGNVSINNLYVTTTYQITAYGDGGNDYDSVTVYVNTAPINQSLSVSTIGASGIGKTTATLSGALVSTSGTSTAWFEYGTTALLGSTTAQSTFYTGVNTPFTKSLSGLAPETNYFYRAVASGTNGRVEGEIKYFRTYTNVTNTNTIVYVSNGTGVSESLVDLDITSAFENVGIGEQFDIDIDYVNNSSSITAKNANLTIILPKNLIFQRISRGQYNKTDHTIFADLEDISPKEEGNITIQVSVSNKATDGELLLTAGTLNYEKSNNQKEEVLDVLTNKVTSDGSVLGAFALGGGFWPSTLIGWLILLIIFLMIIYIANRMFRKKKVAQPMSVPVPPQTYR